MPEEDECDAIPTIKTNELDSDKVEMKYDLTKFQLERILNNNTRNKSIVMLGNFPNISQSDKAVIIFEKQAFTENDVITNSTNDKHTESANGSKFSYFSEHLQVRIEFINDIYGNFVCTPPPKLDGFKAVVIYPATEKHIAKYSINEKYIIKETPQLYQKITLPYLNTSQLSLEWVYNILEHKQELDRIICEDQNPETGYILLPDLKWDGHTTETMYMLVLIHKRNIKSLRDLNATHLPLLENIRTGCADIIEKRYGLSKNQLRMYLHYQPSFYHLHIHINPLRNEAPGIWCEKSHMLDTVINNLEIMSDYYEKATLPFVLYEGNELLRLYVDKNIVHKAPKRLLDDAMEHSNGKKKRKLIKLTTENNISVV